MLVLTIGLGVLAVIAVVLLLSWISNTAKETHYCDGCAGRFPLGSVHPCSGDWWLCTSCLDKYMSTPTEDTYGDESPTDRTN